MPNTDIFEQKYPYLSRFIKEIGWIEIGNNDMINSFVRAYDLGGTVYHGKNSYLNLEDAFQDLEEAIKQYMEDLGI